MEKTGKKNDSMSEEDLHEGDDDDDSEQHVASSFKLFSIKKDKYLSNNASVKIRITKMLIN